MLGKERGLSFLTEKDTARFWSKVAITANPNKCWNWTGDSDKDGYGRLSFHEFSVRSHRVSYFLNKKQDPGSFMVCHNCDNPSCVNPNHLFLGTAGDNTRDMVEKGRMSMHLPKYMKEHPEKISRGDAHTSSKISSSTVIAIQEEFLNGSITQKELAIKYNLSHSHIRDIIKGRKWNHMLNEECKDDFRVTLSESQVNEIKNMYSSGLYTQSEIAQKFSINASTVSRLANNKRRNNIDKTLINK